MRIGLDARLYGLEHAGLGRYVMKLVDNLLKFDKKNDYVLFVNANHAKDFKLQKRVKIVVTNIPIYSFAEQFLLPIIFLREKLDLLHVPHFNAPFLYPRKFVLTVHDLIKNDSKGESTTTRQPWLYLLRRLGYLFLMRIITNRARSIMVPSLYVKHDIVHRLNISSDKVFVTYEAVSGSFKDLSLSDQEKHDTLHKYHLNQPFVVYTGSVYPHKNVPLLIDAIEKHNQNREVDLQLALICSRSVFWERLNREIIARGLEDSIKMLGFVDDQEVSKLYSLAIALVHPSRMEGFGLTGLEAMSVGLPVISSNASCLPEIYGDAAIYFDPYKVGELVSALELLIKDSDLRSQMSSRGYLRSRKYSWKKMGLETIAIYKKVLG